MSFSPINVIVRPDVEQNYFPFYDLDGERNAVAVRDTDGLSSCKFTRQSM